MWMKEDQTWIVKQAPDRRDLKVDELVLGLIKYICFFPIVDRVS